MERSLLELDWQNWAGVGQDWPWYKAQRSSSEFRIDGKSLWDMMPDMQLTSVLATAVDSVQQAAVAQMTLNTPGSSVSGRVPIFVCSECGDLGCGAITVRIERCPEGIVWRDFGYEDARADSSAELPGLADVGPFVFGEAQYMRAFAKRRSNDAAV